MVFLENGHVAIDNNPAENAIFLSLAEKAKANGIGFYQYLVKLLTELPNLPIHQQYFPWSEHIPATCAK